MTRPQDTEQYIHRAAVDAEGNRIGKITKVYLDDQAGQPEWILVETGLFGTRQSFAPIRGSRFDGDQLVVLAVSKDQVKDAPNIDPDARISDSEVDALRQYYSAAGLDFRSGLITNRNRGTDDPFHEHPPSA